MFSKLKLGGRLILGAMLIVPAMIGVNFYIDSRPKETPAIETLAAQPAKPVLQTDVLPPTQPAVQPSPVEVAPQPIQPSPAPRTQQDAALEALLKGGTK